MGKFQISQWKQRFEESCLAPTITEHLPFFLATRSVAAINRFEMSTLFNFMSRAFAALLLAVVTVTAAPQQKSASELWALQAPVRPEIPGGSANGKNPIDAFIANEHARLGLAPMPLADRQVLLRRLCFDLTGLPPTVEEQERFAGDNSAGAYEALVDRLLADEQHGVRYGRHWLDVLRYSDVDERMAAAENIHLWRDWVIRALNDDLPYDAFVRAQLSGFRVRNVTTMTATGNRRRQEPRPEDQFALGFLARGATSRGNGDDGLSIAAVETVGSAFLGMTVACAKCHDHRYDPISQQEFYSMKALFDPLALRPVRLASAAEIFDYGRALGDYESRKAVLDDQLEELIGPYRERLYEERVRMLPPDVQSVIRKPEESRSVDEQKIADDYFPVLRIDPPKIREIMPEEEIRRYRDLEKTLGKLKAPRNLPVFWTVEEDPQRRSQTRYVLDTGDAGRPNKDQPVDPGYPFACSEPDFRDGLREGFAGWLTGPNNPLFARVVVNRIWHWHFGEPLHPEPNDFGALGGERKMGPLLDWLAVEFVSHDYSMKWLHKLIVTSQAYQRLSTTGSELARKNGSIDPENRFLWKFPLKRLEAEPIWDALHAVAGDLDVSVGGPSFEFGERTGADGKVRRAAYMRRGYRVNEEMMPGFLKAFDVDDGRMVCSRRNLTVTPPQSLFLMNNPVVNDACGKTADLLANTIPNPSERLEPLVEGAYRRLLGRRPTAEESAQAMDYLGGDPARLRDLIWLIVNLDEFIYVP